MTGALAACAEAEGWEGGRERERKEGVRTAVGECVCVEGAQGSAFFRVRARTPPMGKSLKIHSVIHSRHRHVITSQQRQQWRDPPVTHVHHAPRPCLLLHDVQHAGCVSRRGRGAAATEFQLGLRIGGQDRVNKTRSIGIGIENKFLQ